MLPFVFAARHIGFAASLALLATGCANNQQKPAADYTQFYGESANVRFATKLPVESAQEAEARGDRAVYDGNIELALFEYVRALELDEKRPETFYKIGRIHVEKGDAALAELAFRLALSIQPDHGGVLEELGLLLLKRREYETAAQLFDKAVSRDFKRWRSYNGLGVIADLASQHAIAKLHYENALRANPKSAMVYNNLGYSRYLAGDLPGALDNFRKAVEIEPDYELAWRNLGLIYAREKRYEQAVDAFERTMDRASAYNNVGYLCMNQGETKLAEIFFAKAIDLRTRYYPLAQNNLSRLRRMEQ